MTRTLILLPGLIEVIIPFLHILDVLLPFGLKLLGKSATQNIQFGGLPAFFVKTSLQLSRAAFGDDDAFLRPVALSDEFSVCLLLIGKGPFG
jgi:hypothetical protein